MKTADEYADMAEYHVQQSLLAADMNARGVSASIAATYAALAQAARAGDQLEIQAKVLAVMEAEAAEKDEDEPDPW